MRRSLAEIERMGEAAGRAAGPLPPALMRQVADVLGGHTTTRRTAAVASLPTTPALSRDAVGAASAAGGEATGAVSASTAATSTRTGKPGRKTGGGGGPFPTT